MKKKTKFFLISTLAILLVGSTSVSLLANYDSLVANNNAINKQQSNESHNITINVDTSVSLDVETSATTGQIVEVRATFDSEKVVLHKLFANGLEMAKVNDNNFYFQMPSSDVTITADLEVTKNNKVVSLSNEVIVTMLTGNTFAAGETIKFKLGLPQDSKYSIETYFDAGLYSVEEQTFERTLDVLYSETDRTYTVEIPQDYDSNLWINPILVEKYFTITEEDSNISSVNLVSAEGEELDSYIDYAKADSLIQVKLTNTTSLLGKGVTIVETNETFMDEDGDSYVTFAMPARNITLQAVTEINYINFTVDYTQASHSTAHFYQKVDGELVELTELKAVPYEEVFVNFVSSDDNYKVTEITGSYLTSYSYTSSISFKTDEETGYKYFSMVNGSDVVIKPVETTKQNIILNNDVHISLSLFKYEDGQYVTTSTGFYGDKLFVKPTISEERYSIQSLTGTYNRVGSTTTSNLSLTLEDDGYYSFTLPNDSENLTISVVELDATKYQDYAFVGSYAGPNVYTSGSSKINSSSSSTYSVTLNADGSIKYQSYATKYIQSIEGDETTGIIIDSSNKKFGAYSENVFVAPYSNTGEVVSTYDLNIMAKKETETDTFKFNYSLVPMAGESSAYHYFVQIIRNNVLLDCIYIDITNKDSNASVFHLTGIRFIDVTTQNDIADASLSTASYDVYEGDTLLGTVSNVDKTFTPAETVLE